MQQEGQAFGGRFSDPDLVADYAEGTPRYVPGFSHVHRMADILLAEQAPDDARVLVVGAGGGLELKAFAQAPPGWTFDGVDPAAEMLKLAERTLGPLADRVRLTEGIIDDVPEGPFDAATCLLILHLLSAEERLRTLQEIRRRLKPGAPLVAVLLSFPQAEGDRARWLSRHYAFALASGADPADVQHARTVAEETLTLLPPEQDEAILREAGFSDVSLFYAAFTWRGRVGNA